VQYYFEWDLKKAKENCRKHKVSFENSATIFLDPSAVTIFDLEHSNYEDRWITMGVDNKGVLIVVVHTFQQIDDSVCRIRIISARKATKKETAHYKEKRL